MNNQGAVRIMTCAMFTRKTGVLGLLLSRYSESLMKKSIGFLRTQWFLVTSGTCISLLGVVCLFVLGVLADAVVWLGFLGWYVVILLACLLLTLFEWFGVGWFLFLYLTLYQKVIIWKVLVLQTNYQITFIQFYVKHNRELLQEMNYLQLVCSWTSLGY